MEVVFVSVLLQSLSKDSLKLNEASSVGACFFASFCVYYHIVRQSSHFPGIVNHAFLKGLAGNWENTTMERLEITTNLVPASKTKLRPATAGSTRAASKDAAFAGMLRIAAARPPAAGRPTVSAKLHQGKSAVAVAGKSGLAATTQGTAAGGGAQLAADIYRADVHYKIQHVKCAREVQLDLRQTLLDLEARTRIRTYSRNRGSVVPTAAASAPAPLVQEEQAPFAKASPGCDSESDDEDRQDSTTLRLSNIGHTSPVPQVSCTPRGAAHTAAAAAAGSRPHTAGRSASAAATAAAQQHPTMLDMPKFSTNFRIDTSWSPQAYSIPEYFKSETFLRSISPRCAPLLGSTATAVDGNGEAAASGVSPRPPAAVAPSQRRTVPLSHDDRLTRDARDASTCGRHLKPFIVPFPLERSLRQSDTIATLFVNEQQDAMDFRMMMRDGQRPAIPMSLASGLFSPRQQVRDSLDFVQQDEAYFNTVRDKIRASVTLSLSNSLFRK
jgi:hypothetical protein